MTVASEQLWETFSAPLQQFILRRVPDPHSAEDILPDVFELDHAGRIIDYQPHCACCASNSCDTVCSNEPYYTMI